MCEKERIKQQKKELRKELLARRNSLSPQEYEQKNRAILELVWHFEPIQKAEVIHTYAAMRDRHEVDTIMLLQRIIAAGKTVVCPRVKQESGALEHIKIESAGQFIVNGWGVPEPAGDKLLENLEEIDVVIVPLAGADLQKQRIGYGKGYYDRFLSSISATKIGLLFDCCLLRDREIPTESHDIPLDVLITEQEVID